MATSFLFRQKGIILCDDLDGWIEAIEIFRQGWPPKAYAEDGGLIAYGVCIPCNFRRSATFIDKILKGAKPGELPVEQPTRLNLTINLKTARALSIEVPPPCSPGRRGARIDRSPMSAPVKVFGCRPLACLDLFVGSPARRR